MTLVLIIISKALTEGALYFLYKKLEDRKAVLEEKLKHCIPVQNKLTQKMHETANSSVHMIGT